MISREQEDEKAVNARKQRRKERQKAEAQGDEEEEFYCNFSDNPNQALDKVSKNMKKDQKALEKQIDYFGHILEPFNMKDQEDVGDIDNQGFFVFKKNKNQIKDAWLDSLKMGNDQELMKGIQKKILKQKLGQGQQLDEKSSIKKKRKLQNGDAKQIAQHQLNPDEIKFLIDEMLPVNISCAAYMNKIKPKKTTTQKKKNVRKNASIPMQIEAGNAEEYQKFLMLVNQYIQQTGDHTIMQMKKKNIENDQEQNYQITQNKTKQQINHVQDANQKDQDDIF